jgi:membrane protease YdiL (CAAX protease family)
VNNTADFRPLRHARGAALIFAAAASYAALLAAFWLAARHFRVETSVGGHFPAAFASFALLLAPYWLFGFGLAEWLRGVFYPQVSAEQHGANLGHPRVYLRMARVLAPGLLVAPYLLFALPRHEAQVGYVGVFLALPMVLAALFEFAPPGDGLGWQDVVALAVVGLPVEFRWFEGAWPHRGLGAMPKLLLVDAALYAFLVVRRLPEVGYDFRPRWRDLGVGLREWLFFAPIAIALGVAIHFIHPRAHAPDFGALAAGWLITFFFVAIPEELYFRGLLQNLIEKRLASRTAAGPAADSHHKSNRRSRLAALLITAPIFGLSHFNKPLPFNWRYVLLATIAGVFYGRAWRDRRRLFTAGITHATVDVVWSAWFR